MEHYLNASRDLALKQLLDRPPVLDRSAIIRSIAAGRRTRAWLRTYLAALTGPGRLTGDEFYLYGLERPHVTPAMARSYVGKQVQHRMHLACNDTRWHAAADDKPLFYSLLAGAGLPVPRTVALLTPSPRAGYRSEPFTADALAALARGATGPLFAKPLAGIYSIGTFVIEAAERDRLAIRGQREVCAARAAAYMAEVSPQGYMLQEALSPHPALAELTGEGLPSLRLLVIRGERPQVLSAVLKLPSGGNVADNFWRSGNAMAAVDRLTGGVRRTIVNDGDGRPAQRRSPLAQVPDWQEAHDVALEASAAFPGIRTQSWDVALTDQGPVLLDLNFGGDLNLHQLAHDRGILSEEYRHHLADCGYRGRLI